VSGERPRGVLLIGYAVLLFPLLCIAGAINAALIGDTFGEVVFALFYAFYMNVIALGADSFDLPRIKVWAVLALNLVAIGFIYHAATSHSRYDTLRTTLSTWRHLY
jgi:hypothetical protein